MKYQVRRTWRGVSYTSPDNLTQSQAHNWAAEWLAAGKCKTLVVLRADEEGINAGKYFLDRIWK